MNIDHPGLEVLAIKARQARDVAATATKVDKEASSEIKVIMAELGSDDVVVGELKVSLSETTRENTKLFKEALLKAGVSPDILEAAAEASKTSSSTLRITAAPQEAEVMAPLVMEEGVTYY
jgi:hypothetical protein